MTSCYDQLTPAKSSYLIPFLKECTCANRLLQRVKSSTVANIFLVRLRSTELPYKFFTFLPNKWLPRSSSWVTRRAETWAVNIVSRMTPAIIHTLATIRASNDLGALSPYLHTYNVFSHSSGSHR